MHDLSEAECDLLLALKRGKHFKANPAKPSDLLLMTPTDANPIGRRLVALKLAARIIDNERPGALLLRITDAGISEADKLLRAHQKPTIFQRVKRVPFGKGAWDIIKIVLTIALGIMAAMVYKTGS